MNRHKYTGPYLKADDPPSGGALPDDPPADVVDDPPADDPPADDPPSDDPPADDPPAGDPPADPKAEIEALKQQWQQDKEASDARIAELEAKLPKQPEGLKPVPSTVQFRRQAIQEAAQYEGCTEEDDKGQVWLTQAGEEFVATRTVELITESKQAAQRETQVQQYITAQKPEIVKATRTELVTNGIPEAVADEVADAFAQIATGFGVQAFPEYTEADPDAGKQAERVKIAGQLRTSAYYNSLGIAFEKLIRAAKETNRTSELDEALKPFKTDPKPPVKTPSGGGVSNDVYAGLSDEDAAWIKSEWVPKKNGGKPPTPAQVKKLKETVLA